MSNPLQKTPIIDANGHATSRNKKVVDSSASAARAGSVKPSTSGGFGMTGTFKDGTSYIANGEFSVESEREDYMNAWVVKTSQVHYSLGSASSVEFVVPKNLFADSKGMSAEALRFFPDRVLIERDESGNTHGYHVYQMKASILLMHVNGRSEDALRGFLAGKYNADSDFHDGSITINVPFATQYHSGIDNVTLTTNDSMYAIYGSMHGKFWDDRQYLDRVVAESAIGIPEERHV